MDSKILSSKEPLRLFKVSHQILCITGINFESKSLVGYTELTVWPALSDLTEIRINSKQCKIFRISINKKWDAEFTYFDPTHSIGQNNLIKRNIDYFQKQNKNCLNSVSADQGNGEVVIKLPEGLAPTVSALGSFTVCVEFAVEKPQGGVQFVVPDMPGTMAERSAHMFTYALENFSRMWFPCMDSFFDPCTWKIEVTVDRDMTAICCGDLVSVEYNEEMTEKIFHYFLSTPIAAPNIALAVGPFEILVDPKMHEVTHFCLPGLMPVLKHTTSYIHQAFEFYEELMSSRYPYSYYKQVFVDMAYNDVCTYATMSILSTNLLHPPNIIDQTMTSRQLMATAVAQQFFGSFIAMEKWSDAWLTKGITGYLSYLFSKRTFGNNEYRNWVMRDLQEVCQYEKDVGPVVLDPSKLRELTSSSQHPFWLGSPHTLSPRYHEMLAKKARLIFRMLETRIGTELLLQVLNKLLSLAYNASQAPFGYGSWTNMLLSTSSFLKIIYTVTGKDIEPFIDQWVYQGGCARFVGNFVFNRKRNVVELEIKQDLTAPGTLKFAGTLNVTIQELDGSFNHQFKIEENKTKFEILCHSKSRRNKKKKIPMMTGEEIDMDLSAMDADSPVLWLRLDPDLQLVRTVSFEQPDYMWQYQLKYERCIAAQFEAIEALSRFPTPASRYALNDTIENEECYYRVRQDACFCLAKIANKMVGTWTGPPAMITIFRKMFGSHSCPVIIRQNNFSNFHHYYLLQTMPQAMAKLRDSHNLCLTEITKFLLDLCKYNDNSKNKWSDNYYRSALIDALAATITPAITNVSLITGQEVTAESLSADMRLVLEEVVRCLNLEKLMPSYRFAISVSCLHTIRTMQKNGHLPNESEVFRDYAQPGMFRDVRLAAITCLVDFIKGDFSGEHLKWVLDLIENDEDPFVRHHAITCLVQNPPFRSSERSALNVESLVERLWSMLCKSSNDVRLRCGLSDLYFTLYGRHRPSCLPLPETLKMAQAAAKSENTTESKANGGDQTVTDVDAEAAKLDMTSVSEPAGSSMWNQELTAIFAPETPPPVADETEVIAARDKSMEDIDVGGETPIKVDGASVVVDPYESLDKTPVDLTMISGETVVAMEESVVTETIVHEEVVLEQEVKTESANDEVALKTETIQIGRQEGLRRLDSPSHLSEDSLSPRCSPTKDMVEDEVLSLDNIINSHSGDHPPPHNDMFERSPKNEELHSPSRVRWQQHDERQTAASFRDKSPDRPSTSHSLSSEKQEEEIKKEVSEESPPTQAVSKGDTSRTVVKSPPLSPKQELPPPPRRSRRSSSLRSSYGSSPIAASSERDLKQSPQAGGEEKISKSQSSTHDDERRMSGSSLSRLSEHSNDDDDSHGDKDYGEEKVEEEVQDKETELSSPFHQKDQQQQPSDSYDDDNEDHTTEKKVVEEIILDEAGGGMTPPPQPAEPSLQSSPGHSSVPPSPPHHYHQQQTSDSAAEDHKPARMGDGNPSSPQRHDDDDFCYDRDFSPPQNRRLSQPVHHTPPHQSPTPAISHPALPSTDYSSPNPHTPTIVPTSPEHFISPPHLQHQQHHHDDQRGQLQEEDPARLSSSPAPSSPPHLTRQHEAPSSPVPPTPTVVPPSHSFTDDEDPHTAPQQAQNPQDIAASATTSEKVLHQGEEEIPHPPSPPTQPNPTPAQQQPSIPPVSLKRKLSCVTPDDEGELQEPEPKRVVPPIKLSSIQGASGSSSSQPSLKFKLGAAVAASEAREREHHHHHKSKKKKKKHKNKHKHKHRGRDRDEDSSRGDKGDKNQGGTITERPRLLLDMSAARSRMVVSEEEEESSE